MSSSPRMTALQGNTQMLDGGAMFGNIPRSVWEKWCPPDDLGRIPLACRAWLIEYDGVRVLCETGIGSFFEPKLAARFGVADSDHRLLHSLQEKVGLTDADIDFVILSHLHFDHAGGLLPSYAEGGVHGKLLFPRAKFVVGRGAWERASTPHARDRASFIPELNRKLQESGRLRVVEHKEGKSESLLAELWPNRLSFRFTDGHTPGQMHTVMRGDSGLVVFAGDLVPGCAWVHLPVTMGYDRFPERLIDEKVDLYEFVTAQNGVLFLTHDPNVATCRIEKLADGRYKYVDAAPDMQRASF